MKQISNMFKENIKKYGRQINAIITTDEITINKEDINSIIPTRNTALFKSVMSGVEIDCNIKLEEKTNFNLMCGIKFDNSIYEYINFGSFKVKSCEKQEDTESFKIIAYDKMIESMIDYDLELTTEMTIREYLIRIFTRLNWDTSGIPQNFINSSKLINPSVHVSINYTYRDVLDEIAEVTGSFIYVKNGIPTLGYINDTNETIDEEYLSQDDVTIGAKYLINSLVFSRAEESDNIYRKDDGSVEENGLHEYRIADNQILSTNDRDIYIDELFNYLKTLEFYLYDIKSTGLMWFETCDKFSISVHGGIYPVIVLNNEITIDQDIEERLYMEAPKESETDYKCADTTDKRINQTYILVDKQNQKITELTNEVSDYEDKLVQVEQDVNGIKQNVSNVIDYKRKVNGVTEVHLTEAGAIEILDLEIQGNKTYNNYLYPSSNLYPSADVYPNMEGSELI